MEVSVYKPTEDNWWGNYKVVKDQRVSDLVKVSFYNTNTSHRVCVWGNDDFGLEKEYETEAAAWNMFLQVIGKRFVNQNFLREQGFVNA